MDSTISILNSNYDVIDYKRVATTIGLAFDDDPVMCAIFNRQADRLKLMNIAVKYCAKLGSVHATSDYLAASLWLPPGMPFLSTLNIIKAGMLFDFILFLFTTNIFAVYRVLTASTIIAKSHFHDKPHYYLFAIGTSSIIRGKHYGKSLMQYAIDTFGSACYYLENSKERNIGFYNQFGFIASPAPIYVHNVPLWLMLRN